MGLKNSKIKKESFLKIDIDEINELAYIVNKWKLKYYKLFIELTKDYFFEKNLFYIDKNKLNLSKIIINKINSFLFKKNLYIIKSIFKKSDLVFEARKQEYFKFEFFTIKEKYYLFKLRKINNKKIKEIIEKFKILHTIGYNQIFENIEFLLFHSKNFDIFIISEGNGRDNRKVSNYFNIKILNYFLENDLNDLNDINDINGIKELKIIQDLKEYFIKNYNKELINLKENGIQFLIIIMLGDKIFFNELGDFEIRKNFKENSNNKYYFKKIIKKKIDPEKIKKYIYSNGMEIRKIKDNSDRIFLKGRNFPGILNIKQLGYLDLKLKNKFNYFTYTLKKDENLIIFNDKTKKFYIKDIINNIFELSDKDENLTNELILNNIKNCFLEKDWNYKEYLFIIINRKNNN